ncbi:uncharacterized protein LOC106174067 isoform X2 [Lingula anatina]|uniref:Uncharacterized protein LOC106174067 isoform X1 n=1 Tax=Lingula anatina TaxID=7574 RepID=A0A1S3JKK2_LINAN|nr:uncharacterized protein LOC106174067 isoform X1 [Lingula anatina]XP_023933477.1 uncharacterized protein LOC106174067 isoform X2 [Lingula anatina]XP_023933478.1 uncharacterized protein LOC106174067 isoform X2 [Lingula anatina]|eukprot:XP_013410907.1 uncharacterized protein LOC106174067 isoform X1 [Lingula anatina]
MASEENDDDWKMKEFLKSTKSVRGGYRVGAGRPKKYVGMDRKEVRKMYRRMQRNASIQLPSSYTQPWQREKSRLGLISDSQFIQHLLNLSQNLSENGRQHGLSSNLAPPISHLSSTCQDEDSIVDNDSSTGNIQRTNLQTRMMPLKHRQATPSISLSRFVYDDFDAARIEMEKDNDGFVKYLLKLHYRHCVEGDEMNYSDLGGSESEAAEMEDIQQQDAHQDKDCRNEHVEPQVDNRNTQDEVLDLSTVRVKKEGERTLDNLYTKTWSNQRMEDQSMSATQKVDMDTRHTDSVNRSANYNKKLVFINAVDPASKNTANVTASTAAPAVATATSGYLSQQLSTSKLSQPVSSMVDQVGFPVMMATGIGSYASVNQAIPLLAIPTSFSPNIPSGTAAWSVPVNNYSNSQSSSSNITMSGTADSPSGLPSSVTVRELIYGDHTGQRGRRRKTQWTHYTPHLSTSHPAMATAAVDTPSNATYDSVHQGPVSTARTAHSAPTSAFTTTERSALSQIDTAKTRDVPLKQKSKIVQYQLMHPGKERVTKSGVTFCEFRFTDRHLVQPKVRGYGGKKLSSVPKRYSPRKRQEPIPGTCKFKLDKETGDLVRKERTWMPPIVQDEQGSSYPQNMNPAQTTATQQQVDHQNNNSTLSDPHCGSEDQFDLQGHEDKHALDTGDNIICELDEEEEEEEQSQEVSGNVSVNQTAENQGEGPSLQWEINQKFMGNGSTMQIFTMAMSCSVCRKSFKSKRALESHEKTHGSADPPFQCQLCGFEAKFYYTMDIHMKSTHENTDKRCDHCGENVPDHNIQQHMQLVHEDMAHICGECGKLFFSQQKLNLHISQSHSAKEVLTCPYDDCSTELKKQQLASKHVQVVHYKIKPYHCDVPGCGKSFVSQTTLNSHLLVHSGDKHHTCKFCQQRFRTNWQLKVHMRRHTDEKPIKCDQCDYRCRQRASLNWHMRKHRQHCVS